MFYKTSTNTKKNKLIHLWQFPKLYQYQMTIKAFTNFVASLTMALGSIYAAVEMHKVLLDKVLHWPMELFDTTPLGRLLNRFSKDIDAVDNTIPQTIRAWISTVFSVWLWLLLYFFFLRQYFHFIFILFTLNRKTYLIYFTFFFGKYSFSVTDNLFWLNFPFKSYEKKNINLCLFLRVLTTT